MGQTDSTSILLMPWLGKAAGTCLKGRETAPVGDRGPALIQGFPTSSRPWQTQTHQPEAADLVLAFVTLSLRQVSTGEGCTHRWTSPQSSSNSVTLALGPDYSFVVYSVSDLQMSCGAKIFHLTSPATHSLGVQAFHCSLKQVARNFEQVTVCLWAPEGRDGIWPSAFLVAPQVASVRLSPTPSHLHAQVIPNPRQGDLEKPLATTLGSPLSGPCRNVGWLSLRTQIWTLGTFLIPHF